MAENEKALEAAWGEFLEAQLSSKAPRDGLRAAIAAYLSALTLPEEVGKVVLGLNLFQQIALGDEPSQSAPLCNGSVRDMLAEMRRAATLLQALAAENAQLRETRAAIEIRNNDDGSLDEVFITVSGQCVFHLEQMRGNSWWMGCYEHPKEHGLMVYLNAKGKIGATVIDDRPHNAADPLVRVPVITTSTMVKE